MWREALGMMLLVGCGRLAFAPLPADGSPLSGPDGDADPTGRPRCATWSSWSTPQPVAELNDPTWHDYSATLTADDLEICISSWRNMAGLDLWCATRADPTAPFDPPAEQVALSTAGTESDPVLSPDGLELYFAANRAGGAGGKDIYRATRVSRAEPFADAVRIVELASAQDEEANAMSSDGLELYFNRVVAQRGSDLFVARRPAIGQPFAAPVALVELSSTLDDEGFALSADGLECVFGSRRLGANELEVFTARRASTDDPFEQPVPVPELSSTGDDLPAAMSSDGTTIYLNYDIDLGGTGQSDTWRATRICLDRGPTGA